MKRPQLLRVLALVTALATLACVTINVYFPEAAVKDLSEQIEDAILQEAGGAGEPVPGDTGEQESTAENQHSALRQTLEIGFGTALHLLPAAQAEAQGNNVVAPEISNPAIRQIIKSRSTRIKEIAAATGTDLSQLPQIQATYAATLRAKAKKGEWIQQSNGQWQKK